MTHGLRRDLMLATRRLLATPLFTAFAVLSLAVGVGVTTAVYSLVDQTFWSEPPVTEPGRILFVTAPDGARLRPARVSHLDYTELRSAQTSLDLLAASSRIYPAVASPASTDLVNGEAVAGAYFQALGVAALLGRTLQPSDDGRVVVLGHDLWRSRFAADPAVIGQSVRLSGEPFEVVGVAPPAFDGAYGSPPARLWMPMAAAGLMAVDPDGASMPARDRRLRVFGRLDATPAALAASELAAIAARLDAERPQRSAYVGNDVIPREWSVRSLADLSAEAQEVSRRFGLVLLALVASVLVVACTNLSNLVLARGATQRQELAVRSALGASRWRLVRGQLAETGLLAVAGGVASWLVLHGTRALLDVEFRMGPRERLTLRPELDGGALAAAATAVLLSLIVFGLEPALQLTRRGALRNDLAAGSGSAAPPRSRRQRTLLRWQVAISAGFFIIATLFMRYSIAEMRHDIGLNMDRLGVAALNFHVQRWDEQRVRRVVERVVEEARRESGVEEVAVSTGMPFGMPTQMSISVRLPDRPAGSTMMPMPAIAVSPSFLRTVEVPILHGRGFDDRDHAGAAPVIVLAAGTAARLFGTTDAVGRQLVIQQRMPAGQPTVATVVGVARDTDTGFLIGKRGDLAYLPFSQHYSPQVLLSARSTRDPALAVGALRSAIRRVDPDLAIDFSGTARSVLAGPYVLLRAAGVGALALGTLTLLLAMVGLFGIQTHVVSHRTREIGVRMSLGASRASIQRLVLRDGYVPVAQGLAMGIFIGLSGRALVRAYLDVDVSVIDPWIVLVVPAPLLLAAFFACVLPAYRASRVDPNVALRHL